MAKKPISTTLNATNIGKVMAMLGQTHPRLTDFNTRYDIATLNAPLQGDQWSFRAVVAHLLACAQVTCTRIYVALMLNDATLPDLHPTRHWNKLLKLESFDIPTLLTYVDIERQTLLRVLENRQAADWERSVMVGRPRTVYGQARAMALHENDHIIELETDLAALERP